MANLACPCHSPTVPQTRFSQQASSPGLSVTMSSLLNVAGILNITYTGKVVGNVPDARSLDPRSCVRLIGTRYTRVVCIPARPSQFLSVSPAACRSSGDFISFTRISGRSISTLPRTEIIRNQPPGGTEVSLTNKITRTLAEEKTVPARLLFIVLILAEVN